MLEEQRRAKKEDPDLEGRVGSTRNLMPSPDLAQQQDPHHGCQAGKPMLNTWERLNEVTQPWVKPAESS